MLQTFLNSYEISFYTLKCALQLQCIQDSQSEQWGFTQLGKCKSLLSFSLWSDALLSPELMLTLWVAENYVPHR